jgi:hypothetical protein
MPYKYRLADLGSTFSTRPRGVELRNALIQQVDGEALVEIDFSSVLSISYSFADEFAAALALGSADGSLPFAVELIHASDEVARVIERAIAKRRSHAAQAAARMALA